MATKTRKAPRRKPTTRPLSLKDRVQTLLHPTAAAAPPAPANGRKVPGTGGLVIGDVKAIKDVDFAPRSLRGSAYRPIVERVKTLSVGQAIEISVPKGASTRTMQNRLNAAFRRFGYKAPAGARLRKGFTSSGMVVLAIEPLAAKK